MNKATLIIFATIVFLELLIITKIGMVVYSNYVIANSYSITEIDANTIYRPKDSKYEYFYDIKPNTNSINRSAPVPLGFNKSGLRDRYNYNIKPDKNVVRIITLGDSHTYGVAVPVQNIFSEVLEDLLNENPICNNKKYEVINLGMHGYDLQFAEEKFRIRGTKYNPDAIIWYIRDGDLFEYKNIEEKILNKKRIDGKPTNVEDILSVKAAILEKYGRDELKEMQLNSVIDLTNYFRGPIFIFSGTNYLHLQARKYLENLSLTIKNLHTFWPYDQLSSEYLLENDKHPNIGGHSFIAQKIYDYLTQNNVIPCD